MRDFISKRALLVTVGVLFWLIPFNGAWAEKRVDENSKLRSELRTACLSLFESVLKKQKWHEERNLQFGLRNEKATQLKSVFLPKLQSQFSLGYQNNFSNTSVASGSSGQLKIGLLQPLFKAGRWSDAGATIDALKAEIQKRDLQLKTLEFVYDLRVALSDVQDYGKELEILKKRMKETESRVSIGRIKKADFILLQAQIAQTESEKVRAEERFNKAFESLSSWSGALDEVQSCLKSKTLQQIRNSTTVEFAADGGEDLNLELRLLAVQRDEAWAEKNSTKWEHAPSLDAFANVAYTKGLSGAINPTQSVPYDFGLQLSFPLYSGGATSAKVRERDWIAEQSELAIEKKREEVLADLALQKSKVLAKERQIKALQNAVNLSEKLVLALKSDLNNSQATVLELLQAMSSSQSLMRALHAEGLSKELEVIRYLLKSEAL